MLSIDFQEFTDAVQKLVLGKEFDIDVNFPVTGKTYFECLRINEMINCTAPSPITFSSERIAYPHITLRLGTVRKNKFLSVLEKLLPYFLSIKPMKFQPQNVILKAPKNTFYFSEIFDSRLMKISNDLLMLLNDEMCEPPYPLDEQNPHHISLGVRDENSPIASVIGMPLSSFVVNRAQIAIKGSFGTCIGALKTYPLVSCFPQDLSL